jgi:formylglycine-generating enzyme required for sulfatase activity
MLAAVLAGSALVTAGYVAMREPLSSVKAPPGMVRLDVGTIAIGRSPDDLDRECRSLGQGCVRDAMDRETPEAKLAIAPFAIDVDEVTNDDVAPWLNAIKGSLHVEADSDEHYPRYVHWKHRSDHRDEVLLDLHPSGSGIEYTSGQTYRVRPGREGLPAVQLTWRGARAFCAMQGKRLPTENEWEAAARGAQGRLLPWGDGPARCGGVVVPADGMIPMVPGCPSSVAIAPVGQAAQDVTPEGVRGLAGNVAEWVDASYVAGNRQASAGPSRAADLPMVIRGGSFVQSSTARTSSRTRRPADAAGDNVGFRCALDG